MKKDRFQALITKFYGKYECEICGYNKCKAAIEFHHRDKSKKDFEIGQKRNCSEARLFAELEKCMIVCANCHREIHNGGDTESTDTLI